MYLAEDRILCLEIVVKKSCRYRYEEGGVCVGVHEEGGVCVWVDLCVYGRCVCVCVLCVYKWGGIQMQWDRCTQHGVLYPCTPTPSHTTTTHTHPQSTPPHIPSHTRRLEYVKEAIAEADPVTKLTDLLKQRRRWLNGTFFALIYTLSNWLRVWTDSHHNLLRKLVISFEFVYLTIMTVLGTWFGIGILYTIFYNLAMSTFKSSYATQQV